MKRPREYYEQVYFDFLRVVYPTVEQFSAKVESEFAAANYAPRDYLSKLSRDVLCCIMTHLDIISITQLSSCCVALRSLTSLRYNDYWKRRAMSFRPCLLENDGVFQLKKPKLEKRIAWFDAYHWLVADTCESRWAPSNADASKYARLLMGRQTFHTWLRDRRPGLLPASRGPRLLVGERHILEYLQGVFAFSVPVHVVNSLNALTSNVTEVKGPQVVDIGESGETVTVETKKTFDEWVEYISSVLIDSGLANIETMDYKAIEKTKHMCRISLSDDDLAQMGLIRHYQEAMAWETNERYQRHYCYQNHKSCLKSMMSETGSVFGDALDSEVQKYMMN